MYQMRTARALRERKEKAGWVRWDVGHGRSWEAGETGDVGQRGKAQGTCPTEPFEMGETGDVGHG